MSLLARLFSRPGYYELLGGPQVGKTAVACLLARSKQVCGSSIFITTSEEHTPEVFKAIGMEWAVAPDVLTVRGFFDVVAMASPGVFIVLDSLATLKPDHPASKQIAGSINRHIVLSPPCSVLVVNQERYPVRSGGSLFRAVLSGVFRLVKYRDRPFLLSKLEPTSLFLIWKDKPELRMLTDEERKTWLPDVAYSVT